LPEVVVTAKMPEHIRDMQAAAELGIYEGQQAFLEHPITQATVGVLTCFITPEIWAARTFASSAAVTSKAGTMVAKTGMTTVGRWMSKAEYEMMAKTGQMIEGAGGQTFVATGGSGAFNAAAKGSVYAEFQVSASSLLQGGQANWFKVIGPNAGKAMQGALQKQGGQLLPKVQNLSPILQVK